MSGSSRDKPSKPSTRPRAFDDSDEEDVIHHEQIVSFGRDGARGRKAPAKPADPRVIPVASNLDWRQDRKQRLGMATNLQSLGPLVSMRRADASVVPASAATSANVIADADAINTEAQKSGLEIRKWRPRSDDAQQNGSNHTAQSDAAAGSAVPTTTSDEEGTDQEALKALLAGQGIGSTDTGEPLIIHQDESELLQHDIDSRPEAPTLDDYAATPIDQFGMALLRGMGWKEGMGAGKGGKGPQQAAEPKKRAALLGLGAKERPAGSSSSPVPSSSSRNYRPKDKRDYKYVPVSKNESKEASNGRSDSFDHRSREDSRSEQRSGDASSSRDYHRRDKDDRDSSYSRSSHRHRSKSPPRSRDDSRDRYRDRDRRRDDRDSERRSSHHTSSRSDRNRRSDRDRDDRRSRDHRR